MKLSSLIALSAAAVLCFSCGKKSETSTSQPSLPAEGEVGELISPTEGSDEYDLGSYHLSHSGIKLYYDDDIPQELMLALEKYFTTFQNRDFETYKTCIWPEYADRMETYLQKDYEYGLDQSFSIQCDSLSSNMGGSFEITRIRAEHPLDTAPDDLSDLSSSEKNVDDFLAHLDTLLGDDFSQSVKDNADSFEYVTFFVIAKDADGAESMLISEYDILFAVKDGVYYTFG